MAPAPTERARWQVIIMSAAAANGTTDIDERRTRYAQGREYSLDEHAEHEDPWRDEQSLGLNPSQQEAGMCVL